MATTQLRPGGLPGKTYGSFADRAPESFPAQYDGLRAYFWGDVQDLCLVAEADAPAGMGGALLIRKDGVEYSAYLVETADPNASPIRTQTSTGTKAIRLKT
jgi:hypothetical protein